MSEPVVRITGLRKVYKTSRGPLPAVDGVDFEIAAGTTLALVGESGSGKTTLGRCVLGLVPADEGTIEIAGRQVRELRGRELRQFRRDAQMVFQDPFGSLNPRMKIGTALEEPLLLHGTGSSAERKRRVAATLERVRLDPSFAERYPGQLSGGQQQRVGIARALISEPRLIVLDEPTAALDAEVRRGIYELLAELQRSLGLTYLLISHDLASVWGVSDTMAVMHRGRIVEQGSCRDVFLSPTHPYTVALISAAPYIGDRPRENKHRLVLSGEEDSAAADACRFAGRCPLATEQCTSARPPVAEVGSGHGAACWHWREAQTELAEHRAAWSALGASALESGAARP